MPSLLKSLGISSPQEAAELEQDLGIRFKNFTPLQCETWRQQSVYLHLYAQTRTFTHAARAAGVTIRKARQWQSQNTLGFNQRLEIAVLEYTEEIEVLLLDRARQPDSPPTFLTMLLRAQMPEKYGPARRSSPPRDNHGDNDDDPNPEISHNDDDSLEDIRRDLQDLKQFAGLTEPDPDPLSLEGEGWGEGEEHELSPIDQASVEADSKPAPSASSPPSAVNRHTPPNRHTGEGRYPEESRPNLSESDQEIASQYDSEDTTPHHDEDFAHSDLPPTGLTGVGKAGASYESDSLSLEGEGWGEGEEHEYTPLSAPAEEETQREDTPHHPAPSTQNPSGLNRRQRRQLQRQSKRKHQNSNRPRAPN